MEFSYNRIIKCIPVYQNQQEFIIGVFPIGTILKFTKYTKRLIVGYNDENLPEYNKHIQRVIENSRVQKIADFLIEDPNATFPTNLVLHIPTQIVDEQVKKEDGNIELVLNEKVFEGVENEKMQEGAGDVYITIIDGQHRLKGIELALERIDEEIKNINQVLINSPNNKEFIERLEKIIQRRIDLLNIQLVVSFFMDKALEYQAMIFSTINRTQKKVSESLVSSLFGLTSDDSPQKTALQVVLALNSHKNSPFFGRVNLYGGTYNVNQSPPLTQAGMVKSIVDLISESPREAERDRYKRRKELRDRTPGSLKFLPFRIYYSSNQDKKISDILFYFFTAVKDSFKDSSGKSLWTFEPERMKPTNVLQTTVGYQALLALLLDILKEIPEAKKFEKDTYTKYLSKAKELDFQNVQRYPFTSKSKNILYYDLSLKIWPATDRNDKRILKLNELLNNN